MIPARFMSEDVSLWNEDLRSITPEVVRLVTWGGGGDVLLFVQELDFDLGGGFAGEVRALDVYDQ
jgi:hypothetical protein